MKNLTRYPVALTRRSQTTGKSLVKRSCYVQKATYHYRLRFIFSFLPPLDDEQKSKFVDEIILDMDGICSFVSTRLQSRFASFLIFSFLSTKKINNRRSKGFGQNTPKTSRSLDFLCICVVNTSVAYTTRWMKSIETHKNHLEKNGPWRERACFSAMPVKPLCRSFRTIVVYCSKPMNKHGGIFGNHIRQNNRCLRVDAKETKRTNNTFLNNKKNRIYLNSFQCNVTVTIYFEKKIK